MSRHDQTGPGLPPPLRDHLRRRDRPLGWWHALGRLLDDFRNGGTGGRGWVEVVVADPAARAAGLTRATGFRCRRFAANVSPGDVGRLERRGLTWGQEREAIDVPAGRRADLLARAAKERWLTRRVRAAAQAANPAARGYSARPKLDDRGAGRRPHPAAQGDGAVAARRRRVVGAGARRRPAGGVAGGRRDGGAVAGRRRPAGRLARPGGDAGGYGRRLVGGDRDPPPGSPPGRELTRGESGVISAASRSGSDVGERLVVGVAHGDRHAGRVRPPLGPPVLGRGRPGRRVSVAPPPARGAGWGGRRPPPAAARAGYGTGPPVCPRRSAAEGDGQWRRAGRLGRDGPQGGEAFVTRGDVGRGTADRVGRHRLGGRPPCQSFSRSTPRPV